jgi:hypothetical protein
MAEIIRHEPELFGEYIPMVVSLLTSMAEEDLEHFRPGILWAIGRLGPLAEDHLADVLSAVVASLDDSNSQARGMAVWCLGELGRSGFLAKREDLLSDQGPVDFYADGPLDRTTVGRLTERALLDRPREA